MAGIPSKKIVPPSERPEKVKYQVFKQSDCILHRNLFDNSFVEYYTDNPKGNFDIMFDQKLYEPPRSVIQLEKRMEKEAAARIAASQK